MFKSFAANAIQASRRTRAARLAETRALLKGLLRGAALPDLARPTGWKQPMPEFRPSRWSAADVSPAATAPATPPGAEGGRFLAASFANEAGARSYKLYVPSGYRPDVPAPLIVMLHGCTQSPDDFAAGTRMNAVAEERACLVVYPGQPASANRQKCWNWFNEGDQRRGAGEPSLIAGITRQVMSDYAVDPRRVYVAGMSAGGAAAAIMGACYPDLYAAIGVHSGLACGAARDLSSALIAMRQGSAGKAANDPGRGTAQLRQPVPTIVFHGDRDHTVSPANGDAVVAQGGGPVSLSRQSIEGRCANGHTYRRTMHADADGRVVIEQWVIQGAGHAWSGGAPAGSYTDGQGPDATREMLRFFLEHPHPGPASGRSF